jgi:hypothetical protein
VTVDQQPSGLGGRPPGTLDAKFDPDVRLVQDPQPSPETRTAEVGGKADEPFLRRLWDALFEEEPTGEGEAAQPRRLPPAPY